MGKYQAGLNLPANAIFPIITKKCRNYALLNGIFAIMFNRPVFYSVFLSLLLFACSRHTPPTQTAEGSPGEVLVVCNEKFTDTVENLFQIQFRRYSYNNILLFAEKAEKQEFEPSFYFWVERDKAWEGSEKLNPLLIVVEVQGNSAGRFSSDLNSAKPEQSEKLNNAKISVYRNVWALKQTVIRLELKNTTLTSEVSEKIEGLLEIAEKQQGLPGNLAPNAYTDSVSNLIRGNYGFSFQFPPQFRLNFSNREVVWLSQETQKFYRHIFINIFSDSLLPKNTEEAVKNRNLYAEKYLKNTEGTRVKVSESSLFPLTFNQNNKIANQQVSVLRGWYSEEGTYRRGPFVRYFFHDKANARVIAVDGFLYAPNMNRLSFYRTFDLIAETMKFNAQ